MPHREVLKRSCGYFTYTSRDLAMSTSTFIWIFLDSIRSRAGERSCLYGSACGATKVLCCVIQRWMFPTTFSTETPPYWDFPDTGNQKAVEAMRLEHLKIGGSSRFLILFLSLRVSELAPHLLTLTIQNTSLFIPDEGALRNSFPSDSYWGYTSPSIESLYLINLRGVPENTGLSSLDAQVYPDHTAPLWRAIVGRTRNIVAPFLNTRITRVLSVFEPLQMYSAEQRGCGTS